MGSALIEFSDACLVLRQIARAGFVAVLRCSRYDCKNSSKHGFRHAGEQSPLADKRKVGKPRWPLEICLSFYIRRRSHPFPARNAAQTCIACGGRRRRMESGRSSCAPPAASARSGSPVERAKTNSSDSPKPVFWPFSSRSRPILATSGESSRTGGSTIGSQALALQLERRRLVARH